MVKLLDKFWHKERSDEEVLEDVIEEKPYEPVRIGNSISGDIYYDEINDTYIIGGLNRHWNLTIPKTDFIDMEIFRSK